MKFSLSKRISPGNLEKPNLCIKEKIKAKRKKTEPMTTKNTY